MSSNSNSRRLRTLEVVGATAGGAAAAAANEEDGRDNEDWEDDDEDLDNDDIDLNSDDEREYNNKNNKCENDDDEVLRKRRRRQKQRIKRRHPYAFGCLPGPFVVLPGMNGDGMANSLDVLMLTTTTTALTTTRTTTLTPPTTTAASMTTTLTTTTASPPAPTRTSPAGLGLGLGGMFVGAAAANCLTIGGTTARMAAPEAPDAAPVPATTPTVSGDNVEDVVDDNSTSSSMVMVTSTTTNSNSEGVLDHDHDPNDRGSSLMDVAEVATETPVVADNDDPPVSEQASSEPQQQEISEDQQRVREWEEECRKRERAQHAEWIEALGLARDPNRLRSAMALPTKPEPSVSTSTSTSTSASSTSNATDEYGWWRHRDTNRLIVFDMTLVNDEDGAINISVASAASTAPTVTTLAPGSHVMATRAHTVEFRTLKPVPAPGDGDSMAATAASNMLSQGEPGTIQLLRIESPHAGWVVRSWNGYSFLSPGTHDQYTNVDPWLWRVTCPSGAFVREGLYLGTKRVAVIPYGHLLTVDRKTVNAQGLSRLRVRYMDSSGTVVRGWCSEFLNPVSGQRGPIVQPLPFPAPALYRVLLDEGAVVRTGIELSSPVIGRAKKGQIVCVTSRTFSEHPQDRCLHRVALAGNGGYVSLRLNKAHPENLLVLERADSYRRFDPERPGDFHLSWVRMVHAAKEESHRRGANPADANPVRLQRPPSSRLSPDVSSIDEDDGGGDDPVLPQALSEDDSLFGGLVDMYSPTALQTSSPTSRSPRHRPDGQGAPPAGAASSPQSLTLDGCGGIADDGSSSPMCLICLCEERTATLVHGATGHICCCLVCARILKARGDGCPVCRLPIDLVVQHFWA